MDQGRTVAIAGGSGLVGARAVEHLLARDDVARVVAVGRRPLTRDHPKLDSRTVDFGRTEALGRALPDGLDTAVCALGTTMGKAGSRPAFRAVDQHAVVAFAEAARFRGARRFATVSSIGADPDARSFYLRVKGETEVALARIGFERLVVLRPSLLDDEGARNERRIGERFALSLARPVFAVLGRERRYAPIPADTVGRALVRLALGDAGDPQDGGTGVRVVESEALHRIGAPD